MRLLPSETTAPHPPHRIHRAVQLGRGASTRRAGFSSLAAASLRALPEGKAGRNLGCGTPWERSRKEKSQHAQHSHARPHWVPHHQQTLPVYAAESHSHSPETASVLYTLLSGLLLTSQSSLVLVQDQQMPASYIGLIQLCHASLPLLLRPRADKKEPDSAPILYTGGHLWDLGKSMLSQPSVPCSQFSTEGQRFH